MLGVLIDQKVLQHLLLKRLPKLCRKLQENNFSLDLLAFKWLVCLFVNNLPEDTEYLVWDLFFIKGSQVLFRVALTVLELMQDEILKADDFKQIYDIIDQFGKEKVDKHTLLSHLAGKVTNRDIDELRQYYRPKVVESVQSTINGTSY